MRDLMLTEMKRKKLLANFKNLTWTRNRRICLCRLYKSYVARIGFI